FEVLESHYLLNILVVLLLSIPMYICSTGSIPIALSLLMKGISPGAALIFLMAGPATNVATLAVVRKVLGTRCTLLYLFSIVLGAICCALFIDFALPAEWFEPRVMAVTDSAHSAEGSSWFNVASSILFVALLLNAYIVKYWGGVTHTHEKIEIPTEQSIHVEGMRCNHCKANVERAVSALPGVSAVVVELKRGVVKVEGEASREQICSTISQLGFEVKP
ncbi:MAG: cation transporter, partial [Rikenellaceae bacterium]